MDKETKELLKKIEKNILILLKQDGLDIDNLYTRRLAREGAWEVLQTLLEEEDE